ncbi:phosphoenolpyruvate synthase, partial [bacterium]|nr:phosphoenolpyruvate synthase [bacterium]
PFSKITKKDVYLAGGKGASLGEMTNAKIPVPGGFVITADVFDEFLLATDLYQDIKAQLAKVNYQDTNLVDKVSNVIRDLINDAEFPLELAQEIVQDFKKLKCQYVAVRSSATAEDSSTASWAGELDTFLNTTEKTLTDNVKRCWSSLFTPRAIFYRKEKKLLKAKVSVAVVIQRMIQSGISGITFTVHPVTKDQHQMIIEAGYGLGEAIVSGSITPDSYVIDKRDFSILDINIAEQSRKLIQKSVKGDNKCVKISKAEGEKQVLTGKQIIELARLCANIEKHYKFSCDIEWAWARGKFYITQSRPITTL